MDKPVDDPIIIHYHPLSMWGFTHSHGGTPIIHVFSWDFPYKHCGLAPRLMRNHRKAGEWSRGFRSVKQRRRERDDARENRAQSFDCISDAIPTSEAFCLSRRQPSFLPSFFCRSQLCLSTCRLACTFFLPLLCLTAPLLLGRVPEDRPGKHIVSRALREIEWKMVGKTYKSVPGSN